MYICDGRLFMNVYRQPSFILLGFITNVTYTLFIALKCVQYNYSKNKFDKIR